VTGHWFYSLMNPMTGMVQVYKERREGDSTSVYQLVVRDRLPILVRLNFGIPKAVRPTLEPGGPPPLKVRRGVARRPPSGPCIHCGSRTMPEGVSNSFFAVDYSVAGFTCPLCGGHVIFL
jgi:hypothetical protein